MSVKPLDSYIKSSVGLFEVGPSQSLFSITYRCPENAKKARVTFRTQNSHLGTSFKFSTNKSKDVSRLLNAMGPRGVSIVPGRIERQAARKGKKQSGGKRKRTRKSKIVDSIGVSSLIVNTKVAEYKPVQAAPATAGSNAASAGNNKKKNNKKNKNKNKKR